MSKINDFKAAHIVRMLVTILAIVLVPTSLAQGNTSRVSASASIAQGPGPNRHLVVQIKLTIPDNQHVYASADHFFRVRIDRRQGLGDVTTTLPETKLIEDPFSRLGSERVKVFAQRQARIKLSAPVTGGHGDEWALRGSVRWQACSDKLCFPPSTQTFSFSGTIGITNGKGTAEGKTEEPDTTTTGDKTSPSSSSSNWQSLIEDYRIAAASAGYQGSEKFLRFLENARKGEAHEGFFANLGTKPLWVAVILILLGGLLLNFTPCVLPMIPVNLAIIGAGARAGSKSRGLALGGVYGLGIALAYGILGLLVVLTGKAFGTINSSPWFNLAIAVLFIVLSLAIFGVFNIDLSKLSSQFESKDWQAGSFTVAFVMGGISALLAGACVAPIVIAVLVLAAERYADGNLPALLYPFLLGVGMALPWPFAGAGLSFLPKPGGWMTYVKYVFGVFILALALYYGWTAYQLFRNSANARITNEKGTTESNSALRWHTDLALALRKGLREGKPVLIDFWATWCKNCHAMDRTTLNKRKVQRALEDFVLLKYQAEDLEAPRHQPVLEYFDVIGLPTYVVVKPTDPGN